MILACLILLAVVTVLLIALGWRVVAAAPSDRLVRRHLLTKYVVTVEAGETFSGLLAAVDGRTVVLREVSVLMKDGSSSAVDGDVELRRESISYMQRPVT